MPIAPAAAVARAAPPPALAPEPRPFGAVLEARGPLRPPAPPPPRPAVPPALAAVERAQARLDAVLAAARSGRTFTAQELLGLQAEAYRTAQTVDLAAKLVEQGAQSVKQAVNTQL
ncbi:hypothetical protein [Anaeromyxobacter oryzae]|uniref:Uncharacterized protein n=1 Tax=Anaeromyxobacter oryzae TaxID=2918170 RepID=A0ABN6MV16_9BACT|nr:hypothetical protein [Anaeromyxobacter oryzae]BDG04366.1 hypothetical protein AMOR_33620 [Anaeromyxobacter oryzae]